MGSLTPEEIEKNPLLLTPSPEQIRLKIEEARTALKKICSKLGMIGIKLNTEPDTPKNTDFTAGMDMNTLMIYIREGWALYVTKPEVWAVLGHEVHHNREHPKNNRINTDEINFIKNSAAKEHDTLAGILHNLYSDTIINRVAMFSAIGTDTEYKGFTVGMSDSYGQQYHNYEAEYARYLFYRMNMTKDDILKKYPSWKDIQKYQTEFVPIINRTITIALGGFDNVVTNIQPSAKEKIRWMGYIFNDLGIMIHILLQYMAILDNQWRNRESMFRWVDKDPIITALDHEFGDIKDKLKKLYTLAHFYREEGISSRPNAMLEYCKIMIELIMRTQASDNWTSGILMCPKCQWVDMDHGITLKNLSADILPDTPKNDAFTVEYQWECPQCKETFDTKKTADLKKLRALGYYSTACSVCGKETMKLDDISPSTNYIALTFTCENALCPNPSQKRMVIKAFIGVECQYCGGWSAPDYHRHQEIIKNMNLGTVSITNPHKGQDIPPPIGTFKYWIWTQCLQCEDARGNRTKKYDSIVKRISKDPQSQQDDLVGRYWAGEG